VQQPRRVLDGGDFLFVQSGGGSNRGRGRGRGGRGNAVADRFVRFVIWIQFFIFLFQAWNRS
jgi:hypothetical protein